MESEGLEWLRLFTNFLDGASFKFMRKAKVDGIADLRDKLEAVWFELLGLAGKCNNHGALWNENVSYGKVGEIAVMTDRTENEVKICLDFYQSQKMGELTDSGFVILNFDKFQLTDRIEKIRQLNAERQRKHREAVTLLSRDGHVTSRDRSKNKNENVELEEEKDVYEDRGERICFLSQALIKKGFIEETDSDFPKLNDYLKGLKIDKRTCDCVSYVSERLTKDVRHKVPWFIKAVDNYLSSPDLTVEEIVDKLIKETKEGEE
jgi:phage replisome organizer, putative, N-terminal region